MRCVITGGTGFLGQMLARSILKRGQLLTQGASGGPEHLAPVRELLLVDVARPKKLLFDDLESKTQIILGDVSDRGVCESLLRSTGDGTPISVFHLGAIMSGQGEADFHLAMRVNLHGIMHLLEAARHCGAPRPRFVMASAGATLGAGAPTDFVKPGDAVSDATRATPHTT
jgi:nucleoside-diphosphate-sugar epimerase